MRFTVDELAAITRGAVSADGGAGSAVVDGVAIDSRLVGPGQLFVPLVADRDGHDFVPAALANGAVAYLSSRPPSGGLAVVVDDTAMALRRIGQAARDRLGDRVIGVTGSVGKTSVKDLLAATLATTLRTAASERSFNNEIGVPLTLANAPDDTEILVAEMGARGLGHIDDLCRIARPTTAIVTMVAEVHTSEFADLAQVARTKGELVRAIPGDGFVILNDNDPRVRAMAAETDARVLTFGVSGDIVAERVDLDDSLRPRFRLRSPWGSVDVHLSVHGVHQVANALAAAAGALVHDVPIEAVAEGLGRASLSPWRMEIHRTTSGAVVVNDAYNANPTSVAAALQSLASLPAARKIAVLGVMAELGPASAQRHRQIGRMARALDIDVIAVGTSDYEAHVEVADAEAAIAAVGPLGPDDAVLVKASRSADLQRVAHALLEG